MKWELEEGGTLGAGQEVSPVQYPRSDIDRNADGTVYKGGASQHEDPLEAIRTNDTGNVNVPRHNDPPIDYEDDGDGDEGYGVSEAKSGDEEGAYTQ